MILEELELTEEARTVVATPSVMPAFHNISVEGIRAETHKPSMVVSTLLHVIIEGNCVWALVHGMTRSWYRYPDEGSFNTDGMTNEQISRTVVLSALETLISANVGPVALYAESCALQEVLLGVEPMVPGLSVVTDEPSWAQKCIQEASGLITSWMERADRQKRRDAHSKWLSMVGPVVVHVDASARVNRNVIGIGFAVTDDVMDDAGEKLQRVYSFFSAKGVAAHTGGSTLAELVAIKHATRHGMVLTGEVKRNERGLKVVTDSLESVKLLTALRTGKPVHHRVTKDQRECGLKIIESLARIEDVTFEWVRGHDGDPLNEAADRLAVAARRNDEMDIPKEIATGMIAQIAADTRATMRSSASK